jgi:hypothetical protein
VGKPPCMSDEPAGHVGSGHFCLWYPNLQRDAIQESVILTLFGSHDHDGGVVLMDPFVLKKASNFDLVSFCKGSKSILLP